MVARKKPRGGTAKRKRTASAAPAKPAAGKRGRKPPPPGETKRDRFVRLCEERMTKAIKAIELLGNLSAPHYMWQPEDLDPMHQALMDAIERTFQRFEAREPRKEAPAFRLQ